MAKSFLIASFQNGPEELFDRVGVPLFDGHFFLHFAFVIEEFQEGVRATQVFDRQSRERVGLSALDERLQLRPPRQFSSAELETSGGVLLSRDVASCIVLATFRTRWLQRVQPKLR